jgi:ribosome biogenesis GTPase / thiamine phosphate phosphatase
MKTGRVIQTTGANHIVDVEGQEINCSIKGKLRLKGYRSTNPVAAGDYVDVELLDEKNGVIAKIRERNNCIVRKSTNLSKETHVLASNIDRGLFIFTLKNPETTTVFLDRFLVAAESYSIPVTIVFNKVDIYSKEEIIELAEIMATYDMAGYHIISTSVTKNSNLHLVKEILCDKTTVIAGHSGVGKSSLINAIAPGFNLKTASISDSHSSGKHTTTFAKMLKLPFGGYIIDTPGIRGFGLVHLKREEIYHYFKEIFEFSHKCRFQNCTHVNEPDCAVKKAVDDGEIAFSRYKSYLNIVLDDDDKHRNKEC